MRIILKPMGVTLLAAVLVLLGITSFMGLHARQNSAAPPTAVSSAPPAAPQTSNVSWKLNAAEKSVDGTALGSSSAEFAIPDTVAKSPAGQESGTFSVHIRATTVGKTDPFPKYGIRVNGNGPNDWMEAWIDPVNHVLARFGQIGDQHLDWRNTPLPADFDPAKDHELRIEWQKNGKEWNYSVDGNTSTVQQDSFPEGFSPTAVLLRNEDCRVTYSRITVK